MSWEQIAEEISDRWGIAPWEALLIVRFVARKLETRGASRGYRWYARGPQSDPENRGGS